MAPSGPAVPHMQCGGTLHELAIDLANHSFNLVVDGSGTDSNASASRTVLQAVTACSWQLAHSAGLLLPICGCKATRCSDPMPACNAQKLACSSLCPTRTAGKAPTRISRVYATKMQEATGLFQIFYRTRSTYAGERWASHAVLAHCTHRTFAGRKCNPLAGPAALRCMHAMGVPAPPGRATPASQVAAAISYNCTCLHLEGGISD